MGKSLVIVESPAKAKTINKYLGNDYIVKSSVGHIRDLPTSGSAQKSDPKERAKQAALTRKMSPEEKAEYKARKSKEQLINRMGVNPENGWEAHYEILPGKEKVVEELKKLAKNADTIYLATDLDREGEAIAWHLKESIGGEDDKFRRVVFNEITKKAITSAFDDPSQLDISRVNAQQARRFLDRVVGYMLSPLLWEKVARGLSAGRVQSVAVKLVVEREKEIRAFIPEEYWEVHADTVASPDTDLRLQVSKAAGKAKFSNDKDLKRFQIYINYTEKLLKKMLDQNKISPSQAKGYGQELYWLSILVVAEAHIQQAHQLLNNGERLMAYSHLKHAKAVLVRSMVSQTKKQPKLDEIQPLIKELEPKKTVYEGTLGDKVSDAG
jgi:DNA topoisomerase IA